jgi:hypothetical protein
MFCLSRRALPMALVLACLVPRGGAQAVDDVFVDAASTVAYVTSCRKANGAFGPADQQYTDAAWNYPAVFTLHLFQETIPQPEAVLQHGLGYPRGHVGYGHWQFFHRHGIRQLLGQPITPEHRRVEVAHQGFKVRYYGSPFGTEAEEFFNAGGRPDPDPRDVSARSLGFYNLSSLHYLLAGLQASGREAANPEALVEYIRGRQAPGGGFVDVRAADRPPLDDEAHLLYTMHAVASLKLLGASVPQADLCANFVRGCQLANGAFRWHPNAKVAGDAADIYYSWAAVRTLDLLGQAVPKSDACSAWINGLQNHDGGFGDRPGWRSRLYSTYYAVHALALLHGDARVAITRKKRVRVPEEPIPAGQFGIYQGLNKVPACTAGDLAGLSRRGLNLLALKSQRLEDALLLLPAIRQQNLAQDVVLCPEAYPHRLLRPGGLVLDHVGNFMLDPRWGSRQQAVWQAADEAGRQNLPWNEYRRRVIEPLRKIGGICYPEQDFEMELAYTAYDSSRTDTYNAVLVGFNWSPRDFVRVFPWRERFVDQLIPVADADAHGDLQKWSPQLDHTRHLFVAHGPTYADFLDAARAGRVVCVIANPEGVASGVSYYGRPASVDYVRRQIDIWRWWQR